MSGDRAIERIAIAHERFRAEIVTLGAALRSLAVPARDGSVANIALGYADPADYARAPRYYGVVAGRYANRIAGARFVLDGTEHRLAANDGPNSLHSGPDGFDQQHWEVVARDDRSVTLRHHSHDGAGGFPGTVTAEVRYALDDAGLTIDLSATTDRPTIVNLTHHGYYNLAGEASGGTIDDHWLQIAAARMTPVDATLIPLPGPPTAVAGTPFDFRTPQRIGARIDAADAQLALGQGYDHNFVLDGPAGTLRHAATLFDPQSGRVMELHATAPGLQFYSGNHLGGGAPGTGGGIYPPRGGLCLEPQHFPDSPNRPDYPPARLDPGERHAQRIALRFRTAADRAAAFGS